METCCESFVKTEELSFTWNVRRFTTLRKVACIKELPDGDWLYSPEFGNENTGLWRMKLFPNAYWKYLKHVSLYLLSEGKSKRIANYSVVVLDKDCQEMPGTLKACGMRVFTTEKCEGGWEQFLLINDESDLMTYLIDGDCLRLKIAIEVFCGVDHNQSPHGLLQIVHNRCLHNDDDDDNFALHADDNQSTIGLNSVSLDPVASSPSLLSEEETTNNKNISCCIVPGRSMQTDLSKFAVDPRTFDMTIVCEGHKFRCNRFVLGARSEVFKAMLYGEFAESKQSEIEINDISSDCVKEFLTFLMTDTCSLLKLPFRCRCEVPNSSAAPDDKPANAATSGQSKASTSADGRVCTGNESCYYVSGKDALYLIPRLFNLFAAADKYQVPELSSKCIEPVARCISYRTVLEILDRAETLQCKSLVDACWHYIRNSKKADKIIRKGRTLRESQ